VSRDASAPSGDLALAPATTDDDRFLAELGARVRELRERRGLSRKALARESQVSERYLAQLEGGSGNISVILLRRVTAALGVPIADALTSEAAASSERRLIQRLLERVPGHRMEDVISRLLRDVGHEASLRRQRIALIGLRGAGKSTLGARLAGDLGVPLIELNREVTRETGLPVEEVISLYGMAAYRRIERRVLERVVGERDRAVIVAGGGIVAEDDAFRLLLASCYTVWLRASPEEHMARVLAQGDFRPMAGNDEAMGDLRRILAAREALYGMADAVIDTSGETPEQSYARLHAAATA
jgi:XRE family transcriptional regulator, aerobic/anaerobic benzoate catabolism transcriptional regulator